MDSLTIIFTELVLCNSRGRYAEPIISPTDRVRIIIKEPIQNGVLFLFYTHRANTMMTSSNGNIFPRYLPFVRGIRSFDVFFDLYPNKQLSKQSRGW